MSDIRDLTERIRQAEARKQVKLLPRAPRADDVGEDELVAHKSGDSYVLQVKVRGKLYSIGGSGPAAAAPAATGGASAVVIADANADTLDGLDSTDFALAGHTHDTVGDAVTMDMGTTMADSVTIDFGTSI